MPGGIFVSYRRDDASAAAGRLCDHLLRHFPKEQIFFDVDTLDPGIHFVNVLNQYVGACDVLLAVIGRNWMTRQPDGKLRLSQQNDFVRIEIEAALSRGIRVVPVLVDGAEMPAQRQLPKALKVLAFHHAHPLQHATFSADVERLVGALKRHLTTLEVRSEAGGQVDVSGAAAAETGVVEGFSGRAKAKVPADGPSPVEPSLAATASISESSSPNAQATREISTSEHDSGIERKASPQPLGTTETTPTAARAVDLGDDKASTFQPRVEDASGALHLNDEALRSDTRLEPQISIDRALASNGAKTAPVASDSADDRLASAGGAPHIIEDVPVTNATPTTELAALHVTRSVVPPQQRRSQFDTLIAASLFPLTLLVAIVYSMTFGGYQYDIWGMFRPFNYGMHYALLVVVPLLIYCSRRSVSTGAPAPFLLYASGSWSIVAITGGLVAHYTSTAGSSGTSILWPLMIILISVTIVFLWRDFFIFSRNALIVYVGYFSPVFVASAFITLFYLTSDDTSNYWATVIGYIGQSPGFFLWYLSKYGGSISYIYALLYFVPYGLFYLHDRRRSARRAEAHQAPS